MLESPNPAVGYSVIVEVTMSNFPTFMPRYSVNQRLPSEPTTMWLGHDFGVGTWYSLVTTPSVVIRASLSPRYSQIHMAPSGPTVIPTGWLFTVGMSNSVMTPDVVMRATLFPK